MNKKQVQKLQAAGVSCESIPLDDMNPCYFQGFACKIIKPDQAHMVEIVGFGPKEKPLFLCAPCAMRLTSAIARLAFGLSQ